MKGLVRRVKISGDGGYLAMKPLSEQMTIILLLTAADHTKRLDLMALNKKSDEP